jgi:hypothetical protein
VKYALSGRQSKELNNGKLLRIAVPAPEEIQHDWIAWARQQLDVPPQCVRRARQTNVWCHRCEDRQSPVGYLVGEILRDQEDPPRGQISYSVEVILVELAARDETRGSYPAQWPGAVEM